MISANGCAKDSSATEGDGDDSGTGTASDGGGDDGSTDAGSGDDGGSGGGTGGGSSDGGTGGGSSDDGSATGDGGTATTTSGGGSTTDDGGSDSGSESTTGGDTSSGRPTDTDTSGGGRGQYGECDGGLMCDPLLCALDAMQPDTMHAVCTSECSSVLDCGQHPDGFPSCETLGDGNDYCVLLCSDTDDCPAGMVCIVSACMWPWP